MRWLMLYAVLLSAPVLAQEPLRFESGTKRTVMIELFTSQGCSSCPPAEEYLNSFVANEKLWQQYIPVALHVDYWDYLGWKDRFSKARHSQRQREYARATSARTVFTPAFFVNGVNWRPGLIRKLPDPPATESGNLVVSLSGSKISARFLDPGAGSQSYRLDIGLLGMGLRTQIQAGENAGRHSEHEFVLLKQAQLHKDGNGRWTGVLPGPDDVQANRYALIAWVSLPGSPAPIQATGGMLPGRTFLKQ